jgi:RNA polymerase sigma-70 factor (ECF subfamily)
MMPQLLQSSLADEASAAQALVSAYQQPVYRLAISILGDPAEAEEATQDTFINALSALDSYRRDASLKTWLFAITINLCRRRLKKRKAKDLLIRTLGSLFRSSGEGLAHPEELIIRGEARAELWQAVEALGEKHRLPLVLHYQHELSVAEIAQVLDLRPGTVLSRLYTARERLRAALSDKMDLLHQAGENESP